MARHGNHRKVDPGMRPVVGPTATGTAADGQPTAGITGTAARRSIWARYVAALKARNVKAIIGTVIAALVVIALVVGPAILIRRHMEDQRAADAMRDNPIPATSGDPGINWDALRSRNPEIYAWLYVPGTGINLPVLQHTGKDDVYYLTHDQWGDPSYLGSVFSEMQNSQSFTDPVTVLYGHDVASVFKNLHRFEDADFFNQYDKIYIYTPANHVLTYRIVSAYRTDNRHILNTHDFSKQSVRHEYFNQVMTPTDSPAQVRQDVQLADGDRILQLSTCMLNEYHGSHRYIVTGQLINDQTINVKPKQ
ncbi:class B sortase [Bifidobacterium simiarum]|uniref:class B sortase n=1 Tax=Bifidobacterium simiarum TaxID=2045441 RepID=UPI001BDCBCB6|nr:class B sortase [Bifidobacterium simiarum]MBT1165559.1 class B sortase [Bifidobacterium simiarum]